ncbi:Putative nuclease [Frankliniella fusca]|uniref:Nuclease n=1 Tax=Frankliniella fusca TaxID=407009 RepID=A0AAE1I430_9NEOP|nr:Putative nuclease [Frankliniella fusca]
MDKATFEASCRREATERDGLVKRHIVYPQELLLRQSELVPHKQSLEQPMLVSAIASAIANRNVCQRSAAVAQLENCATVNATTARLAQTNKILHASLVLGFNRRNRKFANSNEIAMKARYRVLVNVVDQHEADTGRLLREERTPATDMVLIRLWMLFSRDTFRSTGANFGIAPSSDHHYYKLCITIMCEIGSRYINWSNAHDRCRTARYYNERFGFPGVVGSINGTLVPITAPREHKQRYVDKNHNYSVNLMLVSDHKRLIRDVFIGQPSSVNDARVFQRSPLAQCLLSRNGMLGPNEHLIGDSGYVLTNKVVLAKPPNEAGVKRTINRTRQATLPPNPKTLRDLPELPREFTLTLMGDLFLLWDYLDDDDDDDEEVEERRRRNRIIILGTRDYLRKLCTSDTWLLDGTFKVSPGLFTQLFTIHGIFRGAAFPLVYALLPNEEQVSYTTVLEVVLDKSRVARIPEPEPTTVVSDFELGIIHAVTTVFPDADLKIFSTFMAKKVLPHTEEPSVYVMDNASHQRGSNLHV